MDAVDKATIIELGNKKELVTFLTDPATEYQFIGAGEGVGQNLVDRLLMGQEAAYKQLQEILAKSKGHDDGWGMSIDPEHPRLCDEPVKPSKMKIRFQDIAGNQRVKKQLNIGFVYPASFPHLFTKTSSGVLLYGPPGTGKTLLAKASVGELQNAAFYAPQPADLKGKFIGETEKNIRRVFVCALEDRPAIYNRSIIFLDEIEGIAGKRGDSEGMNASVTALLQSMDGLGSDDTVSVLAATNFPDKLDTAVLRRFSAQIFVDLPTFEARLYLIVKALSKAFNTEKKRDTEVLDIQVISPMQLFHKGQFRQRKSRMVPLAKRKQNAYGWIWACNCDFMQQLLEYGTLHTESRSLVNCTLNQLSRSINKTDIIDLVLMTGPTDTPETRELMNTRDAKGHEPWEFSKMARTPYGYSGSDIDKMMDTVVRSAAERALNMKVATVEVDGVNAYIAIPGDRVAQMRDQEIRVSRGEAWELDDLRKSLMTSFNCTLYDFCVGIDQFRATIDGQEYRDIVAYSKR